MLYPTRLEDNKFFAKEVCHKVEQWGQSCDINLIGDRGSGKSHTGGRICMQCAKIKAKKYGGTWQDYWNLDEYTGIMNLSEIIATNKVATETKGKCFFLDDLSIVQNARKHGTDVNFQLNSLLTVGRMNLHIFVRTFPHSFMVDKYVRHLGNYLIEMTKPYFEWGFTSAKIFAIKSQRDGSEPHEAYLQNRFEEKYMRAFFRDLPPDMVAKYDERRMIAQKELERNSIASLLKIGEDKEIKISIKDKTIDLYGQYMSGIFKDMTWTQICDAHEINVNSANVVISKWKKTQEF